VIPLLTSNAFPFVIRQHRSMSSKTAVVSKRSATTTATVGPTKKSTSTTKKDDSKGPCKLCAQDTILAAPSVKRKNDPSTAPSQWSAAAATADGRKIGENKLLSKTNKTTRYFDSACSLIGRFSPYGGMCDACGGRTNRAGAKYCHSCAYQKGCCVRILIYLVHGSKTN